MGIIQNRTLNIARPNFENSAGTLIQTDNSKVYDGLGLALSNLGRAYDSYQSDKDAKKQQAIDNDLKERQMRLAESQNAQNIANARKEAENERLNAISTKISSMEAQNKQNIDEYNKKNQAKATYDSAKASYDKQLAGLDTKLNNNEISSSDYGIEVAKLQQNLLPYAQAAGIVPNFEINTPIQATGSDSLGIESKEAGGQDSLGIGEEVYNGLPYNKEYANGKYGQAYEENAWKSLTKKQQEDYVAGFNRKKNKKAESSNAESNWLAKHPEPNKKLQIGTHSKWKKEYEKAKANGFKE